MHVASNIVRNKLSALLKHMSSSQPSKDKRRYASSTHGRYHSFWISVILICAGLSLITAALAHMLGYLQNHLLLRYLSSMYACLQSLNCLSYLV
jgi:hypothetical protein